MDTFSTPRLKSFVEYCSINNKVYFFSKPDVAIEMNDVTGFIAAVCNIMNGQLSIQQLSDILLLTHPKETPYLKNLLGILDNEYLLEDVAHNYTTCLTTYDKIRWSRNIEFFGAHSKATENKYSPQEKLKIIKVAIFGLGGVGSNVLYNLTAMGVYNVTAIDFDTVELSNLNRQIMYNESDIGQPKSAIANNRISQFFPDANINFLNKKICSSSDIEEIIKNHDIVISAIDQPREHIMDWFNIACTNHNIPFISGALDSKSAICFTVIPGKTGCIECWKTSADKAGLVFQNIIQRKDFVASHSPNVAIMPLISIVSGLIASEFLKIVTQIAEPQSLGKLYTFNFVNSQITTSESWEKNPVCLICQKD